MITHNSNLDRLLDVDHVVFPKMNITAHRIRERGSEPYNTYKFQTKVLVKGRNGDTYYIPVIKEYSSITESSEERSLEMILKLFRNACAIIRDHFITTEGKDVLVTDYLKIKHLSADEITKEA